MSREAQELPPYRIWPHFQAAFGGVFGTLNLLVGAVSIFRQIVRAFDVGLSPLLQNIFASYVQIFHGLVDFFVGTLTWFSGFDLHIPAWAHDWIILWFVMAGAASRVILAAYRVYFAQTRDDKRNIILTVDNPPPLLETLSAWLWHVPGGTSRTKVAHSVVAYLIALPLWPAILLELLVSRTRIDKIRAEVWKRREEEGYKYDTGFRTYRFSYRGLFLLQTLAIILVIFGLSVLNARTM